MDQYPEDLAYFPFRFVVSAVATDDRFPDTPLSLEFSLRLPQNFAPFAPSFGRPSVTTITTSPMTTQSQLISDCNVTVGGVTDKSFN